MPISSLIVVNVAGGVCSIESFKMAGCCVAETANWQPRAHRRSRHRISCACIIAHRHRPRKAAQCKKHRRGASWRARKKMSKAGGERRVASWRVIAACWHLRRNAAARASICVTSSHDLGRLYARLPGIRRSARLGKRNESALSRWRRLALCRCPKCPYRLCAVSWRRNERVLRNHHHRRVCAPSIIAYHGP